MSEMITFSPSLSLFGFGALVKLPEVLKSRGFKRILIITDPQVGASTIFERILDLLKGSFDVERFDEAPSEPHSTDVDKRKERQIIEWSGDIRARALLIPQPGRRSSRRRESFPHGLMNLGAQDTLSRF